MDIAMNITDERNNWYHTIKKFYLEVVFDEIFPRSEALLLDAALGNSQLIPGLKVKGIYNDVNSEKYVNIQKDLKEIVNKYDEESITDKEQMITENSIKSKKSTIKIDKKPSNIKSSKGQLESDWIVNDGKTQIIPNMIF